MGRLPSRLTVKGRRSLRVAKRDGHIHVHQTLSPSWWSTPAFIKSQPILDRDRAPKLITTARGIKSHRQNVQVSQYHLFLNQCLREEHLAGLDVRTLPAPANIGLSSGVSLLVATPRSRVRGRQLFSVLITSSGQVMPTEGRLRLSVICTSGLKDFDTTFSVHGCQDSLLPSLKHED